MSQPDRDPKKHVFAPTRPGGEKCKWCMFHQRAHTITMSTHIENAKESQDGRQQ